MITGILIFMVCLGIYSLGFLFICKYVLKPFLKRGDKNEKDII